MKRIVLLAMVCIAVLAGCSKMDPSRTWVRVNQVGYLPDDIKVAVLISLDDASPAFKVCSEDGKVVFRGKGKKADAKKWALRKAYRLNFSSVTETGRYYVESNGIKSPLFRIGADAYDGLADYLLTYMRQQQCGYNPYSDTYCHQHDGYIVDHPTKTGQRIDVTGGWHDATDYLQYLTTSSTSVYQLAFAYRQIKDKSVFGDEYDAMGRKGANGIPDVLDQVKWGLDWVNKMNPAPKEFYSQIGDDRDHCGKFRLPNLEDVDYGYGPGNGRVVYFVTGKPQRTFKTVNRTTGVSSAVGKFASTFAIGADVLEQYYPELAEKVRGKIKSAYDFALEVPGNTQTACYKEPYFYEEDTWVDDVELAAATMYTLTGEEYWKNQAAYWGELEPVTPWMEKGRGPGKQYHHYQWYPFINIGHFLLASSDDEAVKAEFAGYMKQGLTDIRKRAGDEPFMHGVPYLWCSNNLTSAAVTFAHLYYEATGDGQFREMEAALRDWLLGCNPWGTTMVCGLPFEQVEGSDGPTEPHSSYFGVNGDNTYGGLVDGPVYNEIFVERADGALTKEDVFASLNKGIAVYHDDSGDYSTNEPTMDGTAGLVYYFAAMQELGNKQK